MQQTKHTFPFQSFVRRLHVFPFVLHLWIYRSLCTSFHIFYCISVLIVSGVASYLGKSLLKLSFSIYKSGTQKVVSDIRELEEK